MKAKLYKIMAPAMRHRDGWKAPKTELRVRYYEKQIGVPWKVMRPLVVCAFRHVQREAFNDLKMDFITRNQKNWTMLYLHKSGRGWWGRNMGVRSRVFIGHLHEHPRDVTYPEFKDMPEVWVKDWKEHVVGLVAHELWHRWQPGHGKKAEMMCELVESDAIDTYRKEQGYTFTPPSKWHTIEPPKSTKHENIDPPIDTHAGTNQRLHDLQLQQELR